MRPAILALCAALLAWLWLRGHRHPASSDPAWDEDEDGVQPADPRTTDCRHHWLFSWDIDRPYDECFICRKRRAPVDFWSLSSRWLDPEAPDPTYIEAREVAIRRSAQSSDVTTEGMS